MGSPVDFAGMTALVAARGLRPVVDTTFALADAEKALRHMEAGAQFGKIVLTI
jgi:NADPH:quinone reductase-like Zn-dependent oxidoreductase